MTVSAANIMIRLDDDGRPTDLARLAPHGWDAADPTWAARYTAAPDQPHPLVCDEREERISPTPTVTTRATPRTWRCPSCARENTGLIAEPGYARDANRLSTLMTSRPAACLVTMSTCGHAFRAVPEETAA